jgi:hypothetical protein
VPVSLATASSKDKTIPYRAIHSMYSSIAFLCLLRHGISVFYHVGKISTMGMLLGGNLLLSLIGERQNTVLKEKCNSKINKKHNLKAVTSKSFLTKPSKAEKERSYPTEHYRT